MRKDSARVINMAMTENYSTGANCLIKNRSTVKEEKIEDR
jgi:hypothetical protein